MWRKTLSTNTEPPTAEVFSTYLLVFLYGRPNVASAPWWGRSRSQARNFNDITKPNAAWQETRLRGKLAMNDKIYLARLARLSVEELNSIHKRLRESIGRKNGRWMLSLVIAALATKTGMEVVA